MILEGNEIKPNKMTYYLERKAPEFESKMHDVLVVYEQVSLCFDSNGNLIIPMDEPKTVTVSYDEKPGIQALKNIAAASRRHRNTAWLPVIMNINV